MPNLKPITINPKDSRYERGTTGGQVISLALYVAGMALAPWWPWASMALYMIVAVIWFMPDRRIERVLGEASAEE